MGKSSSPPPAPDPYQTAGAQTQQNRDSAEYNAAINRVNTYTPYGSQEYSVTGTDPSTGAPIYRQDINLSEGQQQLLDQQTQQDLALGDFGSSVIDGLKQGQVDTTGTPKLESGFTLGGPGLQYGYDQANVQQNLDTSGLPGLETDYESLRGRTEDALYNRNTRYMDQDFGRQEQSLQSRLANQGIVEGSEAYSNAMDDFNRGRDTAYANARDSAIAGGGAEAERAFGINSAARGQMYGEALGSGTFANQAAGQQTAQNADQASMANYARSQQMAEGLAGAGLSNAARGQALSEEFALRNQPINELNAIRSMSQVNMPQFQGTAQVGTNPADITGAINNQYQGQLNNYNAQQSGRNSLMSGLFGLGSAFALSDERAKDNIEEIGELNSGEPLYAYTYKGDSTPQIGVMAQNVEKSDPEAVITGDDGYKRVDYSRVMARALAA